MFNLGHRLLTAAATTAPLLYLVLETAPKLRF